MNFSDGLAGKEQEDALKELISSARNMNKAPLDAVSQILATICTEVLAQRLYN